MIRFGSLRSTRFYITLLANQNLLKMKALKIIGIAIGIIILLFLVVGLTSPKAGNIDRSIVVDASPAMVYKEVNSFKNFNQWSPWFTVDPETVYTYEGPGSGVGAKMSWESDHPDVGAGTQWIIESTPNKAVIVELDFGFQGSYYADFAIEEEQKGTKLTWSYRYEDLGLVSAFFTKVFSAEDMVAENYQTGLEQFKEYIESKPKSSMEVVAVEPITYIGLTTEMQSPSPGEISEAMAGLYQQLMQFAENNGLEMKGMPLTEYTSLEPGKLGIRCGIPVAVETEVTADDIKVYKTHTGQAVKAIHSGDYKLLSSTYTKIEDFIKENGLDVAGNPYEVYVTDPGEVIDTAQWVTHVFFPIAQM